MGEIIEGADKFLSAATDDVISQANLQDLSGSVFNILLGIAIAITIVIGIVIAFKLITEGAEGKADIKQALLPYIIGNVVIFGAFTIWKVIVTILNSVEGTTP